jgi:hypothetical protein
MGQVSARTARGLLIALAVLLLLLVAADRIGVVIAERTAGDTIQSSQHLAERPDVDIAGFPFLTQLATGHYDEITVTAHDVPIGGDVLAISQVRVVLRSLSVSRDFSEVRAKTATATARIDYAELGRRLGVTLRYAGAGRIAASKTVDVAGRSVTGTVRTRPRLANGALSFAAVTVDHAGALGQLVVAALSHVFAFDVPLRGIPFEIRLRSLQAEPQGLVLVLTGRNLFYAGS